MARSVTTRSIPSVSVIINRDSWTYSGGWVIYMVNKKFFLPFLLGWGWGWGWGGGWGWVWGGWGWGGVGG